MTTLSLDTLQQQGAFTGALVRREIAWKCNGQEHTAIVYVRPLSYHTAVMDVQAVKGRVDGAAGRIAASICDEHGKPVFTPEDVTGYHADGSPVMTKDPETGEEVPRGALDSSLSLALLAAIGEVNGLGKTSTPSRAKKKRSGTSSSSTASADAPSPKRKRG